MNAAAPTSAPPSALKGQLGTYLGLTVVLVGMVALFGTLSDYFLTRETFVSIANEIPALAVMASALSRTSTSPSTTTR